MATKHHLHLQGFPDSSRDRLSPVIVALTSGAAALLTLRKPADIYGDLLSTYYMFIVSLMFAFACSFSAVFLRRKRPKTAGMLRISGGVCASSGLVLLLLGAIRHR